MSANPRRRRVSRSAQVITAAVAAIAYSAEQSSALSINQWLGNPSNQWSNALNWEDGIPGSGDIATVYNGTIGLNGTPPSVGAVNLFELGGTTSLYTEGFKLNVLTSLNLSGATLVVQASPAGSFAVQAPTLNISDGAEITMIDSTAHIRVSSNTTGTANGTLSVDGTSNVYTDGIIDTGTYTNNGALNAAALTTINATTFTQAGTTANPALIYCNGNSMTIGSIAAPTNFNLTDFNSKINLSIADSSLSLQGTSSGNIGAEVDIGDTSTLTLGGGSWLFGYYQKSGAQFISRGSVNLTGGPTLARAAAITGEAAFFTSVNVTGYANLSSPEFDGGSLTTVNASSFLYINSTYFRGLMDSPAINFSGTGTIQNNGNMIVGSSGTSIPYTTVNINSGLIFNWDGTSGANATTTIENGELDIYSSTIDNSIFFPGYYGAINVAGSGSLLNVAGTAWTLYGTMTLGPGAIVQGQTISIAAASVPAGSYSLMPSASGTTFPVIQAPVAIYSGSYIYMGFTGGLHLDGPTTWAGGSVISAPYVTTPYGTLVQDGNATVTANTDIFCDVLDMDGTANTATWTINSGVTLTQQAFYLDSAGSSTNPFHSTLNLNGGGINMQTSAGVWTLAGGTINMNQSGANNAVIQGDKLVLGSGATIGTITAGNTGLSFIESPLQSAATTIAGGNVLNVSNGSALYINTFGSDPNAVLTKTGLGKALILGPQNHSSGSQIIVSQGELDVNTDAGGAGANLTLNASGGSTVFNSLQRLSSLIVGTGATVSLTPVVFPTQRLVVTANLNMSGGTLNIGNNDVIAHNGNLTALTASVKAGYNGGLWNGVGINSSNASNDAKHLHAVGVIQNATATNGIYFTSLDSQPAVITDVIIRYTYYGDANDDGKVDGSDYSRIDASYLLDKSNANAATGWFNGDFNYDGVVNGSDYTLIDNAYNSQGAQLADQVAVATAQIAGDTAAVPEPASIGLIGIAAAGLLGRRRRSALV